MSNVKGLVAVMKVVGQKLGKGMDDLAEKLSKS
jgi:hypothetical protein